MLKKKNIFAILLALAMVLSMLPAQLAYAESDIVYVMDQEWECDLIERDAHTSELVSGPVLAEGNHVRWIDRIGNLPTFAADFYNWMEDNIHAEGALVDPSVAETVGGKQVYLVETVTGTANFTYSASANLSEQAYQAAMQDLGDTISYITSFVFAVYGTFDRDHAEVFWLSGSSKCGSSVGYSYKKLTTTKASVTYTVNVYFYLTADNFDIRSEAYRDSEAIAEAIAQRDADADRILADRPVDGTAYDQILYFNDVLTATNAYNSAVYSGNMAAASATAWECISALSGSAGADGPVCEGYARAFKLLCDRVDIPCVLVEGLGNGGDHMWNSVLLDGSWYGVDVTWNDPVDGSQLENKVSGNETQMWIGLGSGTITSYDKPFSETHVVENTISANSLDYSNGPVLSETAYEPVTAMDIAPYRSEDGYTAPSRYGYVFAGWYLDEALTQPLPRNQTTGYAYPKFVQEDTLTVRFQTTEGTDANSASTDLRLLTSVADLELSKVSFRVTLGGTTQLLSSQTVYTQVRSGDSIISDASKIFSPDSNYFVTYTLLGVPKAVFDISWTVVPSWETLDGTLVYGTSRTFSIAETY